jgi:hypothetical protein
MRLLALFVGCLLSLMFTVEVQRGSLCTQSERIIFSCSVKRSGKIVSLCASTDVTKTSGYVQYRFGLPDKIELEFPAEKERSQEKFEYIHYFRAQVDETQISFTSGGYNYSVFDEYNGEFKPAVSSQGVRVEAPGGKESSLECQGKARTGYANLETILPTREN